MKQISYLCCSATYLPRYDPMIDPVPTSLRGAVRNFLGTRTSSGPVVSGTYDDMNRGSHNNIISTRGARCALHCTWLLEGTPNSLSPSILKFVNCMTWNGKRKLSICNSHPCYFLAFCGRSDRCTGR
jgi:hypothetical protein